MKTVTGKIVSSSPVSISKAASILSKFVSAETGASQAVTAYLRRANTAFDELVRLHSKVDRKKLKKHKSDASTVTNATATEGKGKFENSEEGDDKIVKAVKEEKSEGERKKKIKKEVDGEIGNFEDGGGGKIGMKIMKEEDRSSLGEEVGRKEDKKKKKKEKTERGSFDENGVETGNKMKIKEEKNIGEDGGKIVREEEEKKKKKRKGTEIDEESSDTKKKRRKEDN